MNDLRLSAINRLNDIESLTNNSNEKKHMNSGEVNFGDTIKNYISEANNMQIQADNDVKRIIAGEEIDAHEVMTAVEKASMSFEMVMEIRNKMLEAYREIMKTPM